jgi:hypothetical protein
MRTGRRCTTLIQLPVAFCAGMTEKAAPVPPPSADDAAVEHDRRAVEIGRQRDRLADAHAGELALLEVRIHIGLRHRHDAHEGRTGRHMLADLRGVLRHDAVDRRANDRAIEIELRFFQRRLCGQHFRIVRGIAARNHGALRGQLVDRLREARLGGLQVVARGCELVAGDGAGRCERGAALVIHFGAREIAASSSHLGGRRIGIGEKLRDMLLRLREIRLSLRKCHLRIRRIDDGEDIAPLHMLRVIGRNACQRAFDARRDLRGGGVHIGIVRRDVMRADEIPVRGDRKCDDDHKPAEQREQSLPQLRAALAGRQFRCGDRLAIFSAGYACRILKNMRACHCPLHCRLRDINP